MHISLIGMSGVGKTHWAKELESIGFQRFSCDDLIEKKLAKELQKFGYSGLDGIAHWMGQPYDRQYQEASQRYLQLEAEVLNTVLSKIATIPKQKNIVVDTTGSVVYLNTLLLSRLAELTTIIYFHTGKEAQDNMFRQYCSDPKPVIWQHSFNQHTGESSQEALYRCYPALLSWREKQYKKLSHCTIQDAQLRETFFTVHTLQEAMQTYDYV